MLLTHHFILPLGLFVAAATGQRTLLQAEPLDGVRLRYNAQASTADNTNHIMINVPKPKTTSWYRQYPIFSESDFLFLSKFLFQSQC